MFMVMLGSVPAENRSLQPLLGQRSISLRSRTKGVICCADCSNGSFTGRDPSTAQECQLSHCTGHWSHSHRRVLYWYSLWFQKMFLNMESSSINHTFNVFIKVISTQLASSTQERSSTERPRTTQREITEASSISISCEQLCLGERQNPSQVPKWKRGHVLQAQPVVSSRVLLYWSIYMSAVSVQIIYLQNFQFNYLVILWISYPQPDLKSSLTTT